MTQSLRMQRARTAALLSACSNTCYLPATRSFQLPPACQISSPMWCLLAHQNNKTHREEEKGGEEERGEKEEGGGGGEGVKKLLLLIKNEELVHIDRT